MSRTKLEGRTGEERFEEVYGRWKEGLVTQAFGASVLGVTTRTFRRWAARYEAGGSGALVDRRVGGPSHLRASPQEVAALEALYRGGHRGWNVRHFYDEVYVAEVSAQAPRSSSSADFAVTSTSGPADAIWPSSPWVGPVPRHDRRSLSPRSQESRDRSRQNPHRTIHGDGKSTRAPGWPWPGGTSASRKRLCEAMDGLRRCRTPNLRASVMAGHLVGSRVRDRNDHRLGIPPNGPGRVRPYPARPPATPRSPGRASPSLRSGGPLPPHLLPASTGRGVENTHSGGTFLFRSTPGHFYSGLTIRKVWPLAARPRACQYSALTSRAPNP